MAEIHVNLNHGEQRITARLGVKGFQEGRMVPELILSIANETIYLWPVPCNLKEFAAQISAIDAELVEWMAERTKPIQEALERSHTDG